MPTILLVDDSESIRTLLEHVLVDAGYEVLTAPDGRQALRLLAAHPVDLIVTDIYMPEADGLELLMALQTLPRRPPVIAMSSKSGAMDMLRSARSLGAKVTLQKPFAPAELLQCARSLIGASP